LPVAPKLSAAVIVKLKLPAADEEPVIAPVDGFIDMPVGKLPTVTAYVYGAVPLDAVTVWLYARPCVVAGRLAGATDNAAGEATVTEYARDPVAPTVSVAVTVKLNVAALVGVPVTAPVDALSESPVGRLPAVTEKVDAPVPPVTLTDWLYAVPTVGAGSDAGLTVSGALMVTE